MSANVDLMRIGELARLTGKTVRALRLYEEVGLLTPVERTESGYRMYDTGHVDRIDYISRLQRIGLSLSEIASLVSDWKAQPDPRAAMENIAKRYQKRLSEVREKISGLKTLEGELVASLGFLEGCQSCHHENDPEDACGTCVRVEQAEGKSSHLIVGLTTH